MNTKRVVRQYESAFKIDAAKLVEERGYSVPEAAERLGVPKAISAGGSGSTGKAA